MAFVTEGKVVKVFKDGLNHVDSVVVNRGNADGVHDLTEFLIYRLGAEVVDPETKQSLGRVELVLGRGRARHVQEHMTIVEPRRTKRTVTTKGPWAGSGTRVEELLEPEEWQPLVEGDLVRIS